MYRFSSGLVLGFHGCDSSVRDAIINGESVLNASQNNYDWLGAGIYFWENDCDRAFDFAKNHPARQINSPSVLGAVIDPGYCLNLLNTKDRELIKEAHETFNEPLEENNIGKSKILANKNGRRNLDYAVIEKVHYARQTLNQPPFESVRSAFIEGRELYPGAGFRDKSHIQLCIRNPNCIKGFFIPRHEVDWPRIKQLL
jgi:hypothetical protein